MMETIGDYKRINKKLREKIETLKTQKPLTNEQMALLWMNSKVSLTGPEFQTVVRAIERAHGIGE